jgi:hypothetical protein
MTFVDLLRPLLFLSFDDPPLVVATTLHTGEIYEGYV